MFDQVQGKRCSQLNKDAEEPEVVCCAVCTHDRLPPILLSRFFLLLPTELLPLHSLLCFDEPTQPQEMMTESRTPCASFGQSQVIRQSTSIAVFCYAKAKRSLFEVIVIYVKLHT